MSHQPHHIVKNTVLDLHYNGNADALALQQDAKEWIYDLLNHIEQSFDAVADDSLLVLEELTVDVSVNQKDWKQEATQQVLKQLREKVQTTAAQQLNASADEPLKIKQLRNGQVLLFYLEYGFLPWNAAVKSVVELEQQLLQDGFSTDSSIIKSLLKLLHHSPWSSIRLAEQFSAGFLSASVQKIIHAENVSKETANDLRQVFETALTSDGKNESFALLLQLLPEIFSFNQSDEKKFYDWQQQFAAVIHTNPSFQKKWQRLVFESDIFRKLQSHLDTLVSTSLPISNQKQTAEKLIDGVRDDKKLQEEPVISKDAIYVSNAGLVIAAPFLPALFNRLGIAKDTVITNKDAAVCVTHYLCTGNHEIEEYELILPKILCGLHPSFPVRTNDFLMTSETETEVNSMLSSIVEHWSVLKDTSVPGLQESFLRREGKLEFNKNRWLLTVEQKPYDMLLKQLPWNISMLQLSWMQHMLITEWIY
jgi:hypothetical protein